jgi:tetratricopeptide (TPR) repeat protein
MRVIVREDPAKPGLASKLGGKRTLAYRPDLSDAALTGALENEVNDARTPLEQRMQSLTLLAGMDSSHRRTDQALEKYELLASYHSALENLPALALALNGMGEACAIAQRPDEARVHFERALVPALDAKDVPTLSNISFNLARLHQGQRAWALAVEYYDGLSTLAKAALNAPLQLTCHEERGACLRELGQRDAALEEWRAGAELAEGVGMSDQELAFLKRSVQLLEGSGRTGELRELERKIAELRSSGAQELPL